MPNRILRAELLDSEAWLALKDNVDRASWIACFLTVDTFGNMPAGPQRLVKLWRPYGIDSPEKAAKVFTDLSDVDLVRRYEVDGKPYLHIPRFGQTFRWLGHLWPISPWATDEQKQALAKKTHADHGEPRTDVDVDVDKDVDLKPSRAKKAFARASDSVHSKAKAASPDDPSLDVSNRSVQSKAKAVASADPSFDQFWLAYPKKRSKADAQKVWAKLKPNGELVQRILTSIRNAKAAPEWLRDNGRYIPHPASWLNREGWEDELELSIPPDSGNVL